MSSRLVQFPSVHRQALGRVSDRSVRVWWNSCLHPSFPRPSCRCMHSLPPPSPRFANCRSSSPALAHFPPSSPLRAALSSPTLRYFSSPSLAPSTSDSALPPSFSSSPPSSSHPPTSTSPSPPLSDAVQLTDAAAARIGQLRMKHGKGMRLRLSVDSGGCSGLSYKFEMDQQGQQPDDWSVTHQPIPPHSAHPHHTFKPTQSGRYNTLTVSPSHLPLSLSSSALCWCSEFRHGEGAVLVDEVSLSLLKGSIIDFTQRIERSGFEVVNNPNSAAKCGCGTSFQPKHF